MLYLSSIVKYGFVRDIPGRSENAVPMAERDNTQDTSWRRSLLKVAVCQPLGSWDIILARREDFFITSCCVCVAKVVSIGEVKHSGSAVELKWGNKLQLDETDTVILDPNRVHKNNAKAVSFTAMAMT